ncbi:RNA-directed DNA polymerase from mobile element jockey [Eumeta japonica]|uniref:RNA-directed DNA polymerase from mobile element jockey n=1 Tax=Eumeta variegata TaxID=151549 RepID=A0A4C1TV59_EUMVA|nr:RNA-directed DNA polymerase from mobile element jockey [Eumeta japonica]
MEKAFHRMWHNDLLHKLLATPVPPVLTRVIASFLHQRSFCVVVSKALSAPSSDPRRSPARQLLIPSLYATYTDGIPTLRGHLKDWKDDVMLALYANDSAYFASLRRADLAARKIQRVFDVLPERLDKWRMAVNVGRTTALLTDNQRIMSAQLRLRGQDVEWRTCDRYLGVSNVSRARAYYDSGTVTPPAGLGRKLANLRPFLKTGQGV